MFNFLKKSLFVVSFFIFSYLLSGCGGGDKSSEHAASSPIDKTEPTKTSISEKNHSVETVYIPVNKVYDSEIIISEVLTANTHGVVDTDFYQFSDWVELYNTKDQVVDISGFYLSDDSENPKLWKIPKGTKLQPKQYLVIWADKKDTKANELHTNFKISSKKGTITLANKDAIVIDEVNYGKLASDITCANVAGKLTYIMPSPAKKNFKAYNTKERYQEPSFTYDEALKTITMMAENGADIYYTTDGSPPTKSSKRYTKSIAINDTTAIRAIAIKEDKLPSKIANNTFFVNLTTNLPIVSAIINPDYLFDDMIGIYVDGKNGAVSTGCYKHAKEGDRKNFNQDWQRAVSLEYFDTSLEKNFELEADISLGGQCSKYSSKKSFSIDLSGKYGQKSLKYNLYPSKQHVKKIKDFKIKVGAGDFQIQDILAVKLTEYGNLNIDYQAYKTIRMYVNGEYWGIYDFRERKGRDYLKSNYANLDKVDIVAHTMDKDFAKKGDLKDFHTLSTYVDTHDLSDEYNYQEIVKMIDEDNFIDYMALMIYSANGDWIYNNTRFWKEKKEGAKWRWMLDDLDMAFRAKANEYEKNHFIFATKSGTFLSRLFRNIKNNATFKQKFKTRFKTLLSGVFSPSTVKNIIREFSDERINYIEAEKTKWGKGVKKFNKHIDETNLFAEKRRDIVKRQLENF